MTTLPWYDTLTPKAPETPEQRAARMALPDMGLAAAAARLGLDLATASTPPLWDGPTPDVEDLEPVDDRRAQAIADARTVDLYGGGR